MKSIGDSDRAAQALRKVGDSIPDNTKIGAMVNAFHTVDNGFDAKKAEELLGVVADTTMDVVDGFGNLQEVPSILSKVKDSFTGLATSMGLSTTGLLGMTAGIAAAGVGFKLLYDYNKKLTNAAEDNYKELQSASSEYQNTSNEIDNINSELETTQNRISELSAKKKSGDITLVESKELDNLRDVNQELSRNKSLAELQQKSNLNKMVQDAVNTYEAMGKDQGLGYSFDISYNKAKIEATAKEMDTVFNQTRDRWLNDNTYNNSVSDMSAWEKFWTGGKKYQAEVGESLGTELNDINDAINTPKDINLNMAALQSLTKEQDKNTASLDALAKKQQSHKNLSVEEADALNKQVESLQDQADGLEEQKGKVLENIAPYAEKMQSVYDALSEAESQGMIRSGSKREQYLKEARDFLNDYNKALNPNYTSDTLDNYFSMTGTEDMQQKLVDLYDSGTLSATTLKNSFSDLWGYMQETGLSFDDVKTKAKEFSQQAKDATQNANIVKTAEELSSALESATTNQSNINTALANSASTTGLNATDLTNLSTAFADIDGYDQDKLLERTSSGIRLNYDALSAYQSEQEKIVKGKFAESLREQNKALAEQTKVLNEAKTKQEKADAQSTIDATKAEIKNLKNLQSQYQGLTSDYNKFISSLSGNEEGTQYDNASTGYATVKELMDAGWIGTEKAKRGLDYYWSGDASNLSPKEIESTWKTISPILDRYYNATDENGNVNAMEGINNFVKDVNSLNKATSELNEETKSGTVNFQDLADAWGLGEEAATDLIGKLRDAGWDIDVSGAEKSTDQIISDAEEAQSKLKRITGETYEWDFNTTDAQKATEQVQRATEQLQQFKKSTGEYDYSQSGATEAAQVYEASVRQEQVTTKPAISNVDTSSVVESSQDWVTAAQNFQTAKDELDVQTQLYNQGLQNDVEGATKTANEALTNLQEVSKNGSPFDIDTSGLQEAENSLAGISEKDLQMKVGADTSEAESSVEGMSNEEVEVPVTVQLEEGQFSTLMEGITGEEYEANVTVNEEKGTEVTNEQPEPKTQIVNEEKGTDVTSEQPESITQEVNREVNDGETSQEPAPVEQLVNRKVDNTIQLGVGDSQQGGVITYQSKVEPPEVPDVKGKTVVYKSKVQKPVIPDVEGKTVTYKVNVESASVPTLEGTVNYKGNFPTSAPVLDGTVNYSANFSGEVSAASGTANFTLGNSPKEVPPAQGIANFSLGSSPTTVPPASGVANFSLGSYPTSLPAITQTVIANKVGFASGTMLSPAHADGTAYNVINYKSAYADGKVSLPHDEKALVNEVGTESLIRDGKWMLIPGGMHVQSLKKGDIILNASQTADLLKYGKASGHGKAYAQGTVGNGKVVANAYAKGTESKWKNSVDWIERKLAKLEHQLKINELKADNAKTYKTIQKYVGYQDKKVSYLIKANEKAETSYRKKANSVNLASDLKKKVQDGNYDINDYSEENQQKIKDYQEMLDKARECAEAVEELKKQQTELVQTKMDNLVAYYDSINNKLEAQQSIYSAKQKYWQESGHGGNEQEKKMINEQMKLQRLITKNLDKEASNYAKQMKAAKKKFGADSNEYRDAQAKYYEIKAAKIESETSLENLKNQRREIAYNAKQYIIDGFERLGDRLSASEKYYTASNASVDTRIGNYKQQIDNYNDQIYAKRQLQKLYVQRMAQLHVNDVEYQETADKVAKLDTEIINLATDIENAKDSIRKARWEAFNENMTSVNNAITENDEIRKMLNQNGMVNREDGTLNADGYANILLIAKGMELNNQKIADYKVALNKVKEELDHGVISQSEYNEYVNQYQSEIRKAASANKDYSDSLISMYKDQIKYKNEVLQDNIKKWKDAKDAKEDYYQYDKKIKRQTDDINSLKAQIAALEGATNAADKARKRLLEEQLSQKQDDLNDDVHSHRVDLITSGYDKLSQSASEAMNDTLDELETNTEAQKQCVDNMLAYLERGFIKTGDSISSTMGDVSKSITSGFDVALGRVGSLLEDTAIKVSDIFDKIIKVQNINNNPNNATASDSANNVDTSGISGLDKTESDIVDKVTNGGTGKEEIVYVQSVSCASSIVITEGETYKLKCTVSPSNATTKGLEAKSANESYVTVSPESSNGYITIKGIKTVGSGSPITVTITSKDVKKAKTTCKVRVRTKTASTLADKAGKGEDNEGKSLVNQVLKKYNYDNFTKAQQLQFAKDYGVKADESNIFSDDIQKQLASKMETHLIKTKINSFIKSLPTEDRTKEYVEKNGGIIGKYISQKHNKRISPAQAVELGNILGMGYSSDLSTWSSAQKNALVSKLKNYGFSSGGVVKKGKYLPVDGFAEILKKAAINNGDDGWVSAQVGEAFLNRDQVKEVSGIMAQNQRLEMQNRQLERIISNSSNVSENHNVVNYYDALVNVEGNVTEDIMPELKAFVKQSIQASQDDAFKSMTKKLSKEFDKLGMRR